MCSLALARLRTDVRGNANDAANNNAVGMAQKLLLFWRKPARRCWWEGVDLDDVDGLEGKKLKVWIRRVWTLEMVSFREPYPYDRGAHCTTECNRAPLSERSVIIDIFGASFGSSELFVGSVCAPFSQLSCIC